MKIKWTNKYSGEQGYVKSLNKKEGYFENTFELSEAKKFASNHTKSTVGLLRNYAPDNNYAVIDNDDTEVIE